MGCQSHHQFFVKTTGETYRSGYNSYYQLGGDINSTNDQRALALYKDLLDNTPIKQIETNYYCTYILTELGELYGLGYTGWGLLGPNATGYARAPVLITTNVAQVASGYRHTLILKNNGDVSIIGYNENYSGGGYDPDAVVFKGGIQVAAGKNSSFVLTANGDLYAKGYNGYSALGSGSSSFTDFINIATKVRFVAAGEYHTVIVMNNGELLGRGYNYYGQLGNSTNYGTSSGTSWVSMMSNVQSVACGRLHTVWMTEDGSVYTAGYNAYGQLGTGNTSNYWQPRNSGFKAVAIYAGYDYTMAIRDDNTLVGVGQSDNGELGNGTGTNTRWLAISSNVRLGSGAIPQYTQLSDITYNSPVHKEDVVAQVTVDHRLAKKVQYNISINGKQYFPQGGGWTPFQNTRFIMTKNIMHTELTLGLNKVVINFKDELGTITSAYLEVYKTNKAPTANISLSNVAVHKQNVTVTGTITDPEADKVSYRILVNDQQKYPSVGLTLAENSPAPVSYVISNSDLNQGTNTVKIEFEDDLGTKGTWSGMVIKSNNSPSIDGEVRGLFLDATITDADKDPIQYRIFVNGEQVFPEAGFSNYTVSPFQITYRIPNQYITKGQENKVRIEAQDDVGGFTAREITFIGVESGLIFCDATESVYSTDFGEIIKYLDFGTIIAGQTTNAERVWVKNTLGYPVTGLTLNVDQRQLDGVTAKAEISEYDSPFIGGPDLMFMQNLGHNEKVSFYVRIVTSRDARSGGMFDIKVKADPV